MKVTTRWGAILTLAVLAAAMEQPQWEWDQQFPTSPPFIERQRWLRPRSPIAYTGSAWDMVARAGRRQAENPVPGQGKLYSPLSSTDTHQQPANEDDDPLETSQSVGVPVLSSLNENEAVLVPGLTGNFTEPSGEQSQESANEKPGSDAEQRPDETSQNGQVAELEETYVTTSESVRNLTHTIAEPSVEILTAKRGRDAEEKESIQQQQNDQQPHQEMPESALNSTQTGDEERQDDAARKIEGDEERKYNTTEEELGGVNTTLALELLEDVDLSQEESMFSFRTDPIALRIVSPAPYFRHNQSVHSEPTSAENATHLAKRQTVLKQDETSLLNRSSDSSTSSSAKPQLQPQRLQVNASQLIHDLAEATSRHHQVLSGQTGRDPAHSPLTRILLDQHRSRTLAHSSAGLSASGTVLGHLHTKHNPWLQRYAPYFVTNPVPKLLWQQGSSKEHPDEIKQVYIEDTVLVPPSEYPEQVLRTIHDAKLRSLPMPQETVYVENGGNGVQPTRFEENNQALSHFNEVQGHGGGEIKLHSPQVIHHAQGPPEHFIQELTGDLELSTGPGQNFAENENLLKEIHESHPGFGNPLTVNNGFYEEEADRPFPQQSSEDNFFSLPVHESSQSHAAIPAQKPSIYVNEFQDIVVRPSQRDHETAQHNGVHIQQVNQLEVDPEPKQTLQLPDFADFDGYSAPHPEDILRSMTPTQQKIIQETFKALLSPAMSEEYSSPKLQDILLLDVINQYAEDQNEEPHSDSGGDEYSSPKAQDIVSLSDSQTVGDSTSVYQLTTPAPWVAPGSSGADSGSFSPPKPEDVISLVDSQMYDAVMTSATQPRPHGQYGTPKPTDVVGSHREGKLLRLPAFQPGVALPNGRPGPVPGHNDDTSPPATYGRPKQSDVIPEEDAAQVRLQGYRDLSAGAHDGHNPFESDRLFPTEDVSPQVGVPTNSGGAPEGYRSPKQSDIVELKAEPVRFTPVSFPQHLVNNYKRQVPSTNTQHHNDNGASSDQSLTSSSPEATKPSHQLRPPKPLPSSSGTVSAGDAANGVRGEDFLQQSALVSAKLDEFSEKELQRELLDTANTPHHPDPPSVSPSATPPPSMSPLLADSPWRPYRPQFALQARRERRLGAGTGGADDPDRWVWPSSNRRSLPPADAVSPRVLFPKL